MLAELKTNKKIATATHNILAYRYMYITDNYRESDCFLLHTLPLSLGCMMNVEECLFRTVMMMEKLLQGEGSFIYYRLINYVVVNLNKKLLYYYISPVIKIIDHGCQKCDGGCHKMVRW